MTSYGTQWRRLPKKDTWHWMPRCQWYSHRPITDYIISDEKPTWGEMCNECRSKQRRLEERLK
jgi:hypothetical protein